LNPSPTCMTSFVSKMGKVSPSWHSFPPSPINPSENQCFAG
jgi:hypothetical protein